MSVPDDLRAALTAVAARGRLLVAVDFDGTLAPIVEDPAAARPLPRGSAALRRLARLDGVSVALLSGRTVADLRALADPPRGAILIGGHGSEVSGAPGSVTAALDVGLRDRLTEALRILAGHHPGTQVEVKAASAVLHTRRADPRIGARAAALALEGPGRWPGVHPLQGKEIVELSVTDVTKGSALAGLRSRLAVDAVLFVGDDVTDEHAFAVLDQRGPDVGVKVGDGETSAQHRVADLEAVADLLDELAALRAGSAPQGTRTSLPRT